MKCLLRKLSSRRTMFSACLLLSLVLLPHIAGAQKRAAPDSAEQHYRAGMAFLAQQQFEQAISELTLATQLKPTLAEAYHLVNSNAS